MWLHTGGALPESGRFILPWVPANGTWAESISAYLSVPSNFFRSRQYEVAVPLDVIR
jgi:hypothetical protein